MPEVQFTAQSQLFDQAGKILFQQRIRFNVQFLADIAPESFAAGHVVLTVAPGGATYSIAYVTADDESMKVTGAYDFTSRGVV